MATPLLQMGRFRFEVGRPLIMGVVNLTPDSFSDGGAYEAPEAAIDHAQRLVAAGADIIDLGAESTRPGATPVSASQERDRLLPVLDGLHDLPAAISVDTRHTATMRAVLDYPVDLINDINALQSDGAVDLLLGNQVGVCLMHMQGGPPTMQQAPVYQSVVSEVAGFLHSRVESVRKSGIERNRLLVDPGIGFGKKMAHNLALLRHCRDIESRCGCPVLIGVSRKSLLGELTGKPVEDRLGGSIGGALGAAMAGASVLRVHDVAATHDALTVFRSIISASLEAPD